MAKIIISQKTRERIEHLFFSTKNNTIASIAEKVNLKEGKVSSIINEIIEERKMKMKTPSL